MRATASLVWNAREGRLRAGFRLLSFLVLLFGVAALEGLVRGGLAGRMPDLYGAAVRAVVFALLIAAALLLASRVVDRRRITAYGFHLSRRWWTEFGLGLGLGTLLLLGILVLELAMGWVKVTDTFVSAPGQPFAATILLGLVTVGAIAFGEEASFRGYPITNLTEGLGTSRRAAVLAVSIPALFFGLAHAANPGATWLSSTNTVIFGLLFGASYVLTGELALPIGLHFGWDFVQGFVFGVVPDGLQLGSVLVLAPDGASGARWTGLPYGAEGGMLGTVAFTVGFFLILAWMRIRRDVALRVTAGP